MKKGKKKNKQTNKKCQKKNSTEKDKLNMNRS